MEELRKSLMDTEHQECTQQELDAPCLQGSFQQARGEEVIRSIWQVKKLRRTRVKSIRGHVYGK